ncbi:MAG: FtsQ-type POTRA domain-containing protein [Candidatus Latescibacteria bacterium]|nr:FtsQ-type POTRA domain-containing protein [Candidatus Latescibacterota bacterium]
MMSPKSRRLLKDIGRLIFLVCIALGLRIIFGQIRSLLESTTLFQVAEIRVDGFHLLDRKRVVELSRLTKGESIFEIDLARTARRVVKDPMIKKVTVSRILPGKIVIRIEERKPIALINLDRLYGVDQEATLLPYLASFPSVPIITGVNVPSYKVAERVSSPQLYQAIELLEQIGRLAPSLLGEVSEVNIGGSPVLFLVNGGTRVRLKQENFPQQILCLEAILERLKFCEIYPRYIDLRFDGQVVVGT